MQICGALELFVHQIDLGKTGVRPLSDKYYHSVTIFHAGDKLGGAWAETCDQENLAPGISSSDRWCPFCVGTPTPLLT